MATSGATSSAKNPPLRNLQTRLKALLEMFKNLTTFANTLGEVTSVQQIQVRLEKLNELWDKVNDAIMDVEMHDEYPTKEGNCPGIRSDFTTRFYDVKASMLDRIKELEGNAANTSVLQSTRIMDSSIQPVTEHVRLPQIRLQTFDGNIDQWLSFRDLFLSLIHSKVDLPDVEKFHYLKGCLAGEARSLIDPLALTRANYSIAWDTLMTRYNDSKVLKRRQVGNLFKLPKVSKESSSEIQVLLEGFERVVQTLDQLVKPEDYKDLLLLEVLCSRLDPVTRRAWEEHSALQSQDTVKDLTQFLQTRVKILASLPSKSHDPKPELSQLPKKNVVPRTSYNATQSSLGSCIACPDSHLLYTCPAFSRLNASARDKLLRQHSLCRNCFRRGHQASECRSMQVCRKCRGRHHTLVCFREDNAGYSNTRMVPPARSSQPAALQPNTSTETVSSNVARSRSSTIILATAVVLVEDDTGKTFHARALLDSGSECNFMTERLCQQMKISRRRSNISVLGIGKANTIVKHQISAVVKSRTSGFARKMEFLLLPAVTADLPTTSVTVSSWKFPQGVELADPVFFQSKSVDLVFGVQHFFSFFQTDNKIPLGRGLPMLIDSVFGWLVTGAVEHQDSSPHIVCNTASTVNLDELLTRFWSCEEIGSPNTFSPEEQRCEEQFVRTIQRGSDGRYTVGLPKNDQVLLTMGESRGIALQRLSGLERRLVRDPDLRSQYNEFMEEYIQLGHMRRVHAGPEKRCYLPHHPVIKQASTTTKVRVVFDASCKSSTGISLNDTLLAGPVIQDELRALIMRCRTKQIMIVADIEKMFRQIGIDKEDISLQSILWRKNPSEEVKTYELTTVTYGTKPAPFLATRTLKQLATDEQERFPNGAKAIMEDVYMDDVITGTDKASAASKLCEELINLTRSGGFRLRKFASNSTTALRVIEAEDLALPHSNEIQLDPDPAVKTLGLVWQPRTDILRFNFTILQISENERLTKRKILSAIAMLFDSLGLVGAVTTTAKIFMQRLWKLNEKGERLDWDQPVPAEVEKEWRNFHKQLHVMNNLKIQRCAVIPNSVRMELHFFSDASEKAYGACVYIKSIDTQGRSFVHLLASKSKVAPLKCQSIPRLELCGALLSAELSFKVRDALKTQMDMHFWTDSTCVLQWLKAVPTTWTTFVANRVAKIQTATENCVWRHVPGIQNPADLISRGLNPDQIQDSNLWWKGPEWLLQNHYPNQPSNFSTEGVDAEVRHVTANLATSQDDFGMDYVNKFSSFTKLVRCTAYWMRLMRILKKSEPNPRSLLTVAEIREAEYAIIRRIQKEAFSEEWKCLADGKDVHRNSPLRWFIPQISSENLIRVGGRLGKSEESEDTKHPIVLPAKHPFTKLLYEYYHQKLMHAGSQLLLSSVRLKYWPLGGRNVPRQIIHNCKQCFRSKPNPIQQFMGELPSDRVTKSRPFMKTGVDYFGPVYLRLAPRRPATKAYVAVFICLSTKAVHLELVSDLSTERFLQALRRFIGRRGYCADIYSDNGTNFVGARNFLRELLEIIRNSQHQEKVSKECVNNHIQWHFIPAAAPHFGGLWEAAVRSAKKHLLKVLGENAVSFEEMTTLLVQVENCLNSRPITALTDDPGNLQPLTPGHFLIGEAFQQLPDRDFREVPMNRLNQSQVLQKKLQHFWDRWRVEYLTQLQGRYKRWRSPVEISVGRLVIIKDENLPPSRWKMGRIEKLHPGSDGVVRVVTLKTATGPSTRPVEKLCLLPDAFQPNEDPQIPSENQTDQCPPSCS
ncbi:uncharacterized protein LOC129743477 [Uranotaenia lowii]|uniref:uncharacterized protein LOC129743477 n=1 Tax=Uranotaenia lowii TaxID=190385 RepID=UPI0024790155|nr:uncharacterized protein LOC129743477 [Uranotaenia lowii]